MKKHPTDKQIQQLNIMMYHAFLEIRMLSQQGKTQQVADLADAFHNLPIEIFSENFDWYFFRNIFLEEYQQKYPRPQNETFNYTAFFDKIEKGY